MQLPSNYLLNLISDTIIVVDSSGKITWTNRAITDLLGYQPEELANVSIENLLPERYREKHVPIRQSYVKNPSKRSMNDGSGLWALDKNNNEIPIAIELNHYDSSGETFTVCSIRKLAEKEFIATAFNKIQERLEYSQSLAHIGTWDWDIANETLVWTDEIYRIFGLKPQEFAATYPAFLSYIHPEDKQSVIDAVDRSVNNNEPYYIKHRVVQPSGKIRRVLEKGHVIRDEKDTPIRMIGAVLDITQLSENEDKLKQLAHFDDLTKLPNRTSCRIEIEQRIAQSQHSQQSFSILYIDIDNFKNINDTQGHLVGDEFLIEVAQKLSNILHKNMFLSRLGGDEFILITDFSSSVEQAMQSSTEFAQQVISTLQISKPYPNCTIDISASIGIASYPKHGVNYTQLLSSADQAMYQVKGVSKNSFAAYDPEIETTRLRQLKLISDLRQSLSQNEFEVYYQAKQDLKTDKIIGCEALIRWNPPDTGLISPFEFIPAAESSGLIVPIGKLVLEQACQLVNKWQKLSDKPLIVSVNVSAMQLKTSDFVSDVKQTIESADIPGSCIELEITESLLMENIEETLQILKQLKALGVSISIDDFGTGYSSLSYLKNLPVDKLKIDKSFIDGLPDSKDDYSIVSSILALATNLDLGTIAEGVETEEQKYCLSMLGCDALQGYLFSRPIPEREFLKQFT